MREGLSTTQVARSAGCSAQLVRDLEAAGVIPRAVREPNGYRRFTVVHLAAVRAHRSLAAAVGPSTAREVLQHLGSDPADDALARLSALHVDLVRSREQALHALEAVATIRAEGPGPSGEEDLAGPSTMTITQLAEALGVRPSTLRFWEQEGLVTPVRQGRLGARSYPARAIRQARIVAVLRADGFGIPATARAMAALHGSGGVEALHSVLQARRSDIAHRMELLLRAGTQLVELREDLRRS